MTRWSHVALNCRDLQRTEAFYTRWFGFHRARVVPLPGGEIVFLRNGDAYLELFRAADEPPAAARGDGPGRAGTVRHIAFQTESVDELLAAIGEAADITLGPLDFDEVLGGWRTAWLRDPDGVVVEISQGYRDQEAIEITEEEPTHV
jgi:glyoxylase I family protein